MKETLVAVAVTLAVQTLAAMAMIAPSVLAPVAARDLGVAPQSIGVFVAAAYFAAMISSLLAGRFTTRFGPLRVCQAAVVITGAGLVLGKLAVLAVIPLAAFAIGFGYGLVTPVSSQILARHTPPKAMSLVFSIKQSGVPLGAAIAGAVAPLLVLALGWSGALSALGAVCVAAAIAILPAHGIIGPAPHAAAAHPPALGLRSVLAGLGGPIRLTLADRGLRELAFVSLGYASVQLVFITYFVSYLHLSLGLGLVTAGLVYALGNGAGIVGRIVWGAVADRWVAPRAMLAVLGAMSAACGLLTATLSDAWPVAAVAAVAMLYGASAVGWNGVYLAQVARAAPPGQVATATGGTQFFTFGGAFAAPLVFAAIVSATGSYAWAFVVFAVVPLVIAARLVRRWPARTASAGR